jgi:hypothetical protein
LDYLRAVTGVNIVVDWDSAKALGIDKAFPVKASEQNIKFVALLDKILWRVSGGKLDYAVYHGIILISTPEQLKMLAITLPRDARVIGQANGAENQIVQTLLAHVLPSVQFNASFGQGVSFLRDLTGANIIVDWDAAKAAGIDNNVPTSLMVHDADLSAILRMYLSVVLGAKLDYAVFDGCILISTPRQLDKLATTIIRIPGAADAKWQAALDAPLPSTPFNRVPLTDCIAFLQDIGGVKIQAQWDKLRAVGVDLRTPISLSASNIKISSVIEMILIQPGIGKLAYTTTDDAIIISTAQDMLAK